MRGTAKKRRFFLNVGVMTAGSLTLRLVGISFRSWITLQIGAKGMGQYHLMNTVFLLAVMASTAGLGFAVTRTVAEGRGGRRQVRLCVGCGMALSLLAAVGLWLGAPLLGVWLLGGAETVLPLRLLAPGLPFMALSACLHGYFLAERNTVLPTVGGLLEQVLTIGGSVALMGRVPPLCALALGSTLGEVLCCGYTAACYVWLSHKKKLPQTGSAGVGELVHIAAPVLGGSLARSGLSSVENLLIPKGLAQHSGDQNAALENYGIMSGMVMPMLALPSCVLQSAAQLLIPELAEMNAGGRDRAIRRAAEKGIVLTLWFSFGVTALVLLFAPAIGLRFFGSARAGEFLQIMAPIIPLWYLDSVVDGMLKGLDQQVYSFRYNLMDALLRVGMTLVLLPAWGMGGYFLLLFLSEVFNASLSVNRLLTVTELQADLFWWLLAPAASAGVLYFLLRPVVG